MRTMKRMINTGILLKYVIKNPVIQKILLFICGRMKSNSLSEIPIYLIVNISNISMYKAKGRIKFSGIFTPVGGKVVDKILVYAEEVLLGTCKPYDVSSEGEHGVKHFEVEVDWCENHSRYDFHAKYADNTRELLASVEPEDYEKREEYKSRMASRLESLPMPPGDLVFQTQGINDVEVYKESIIPSVYHFKQIFDELNVDYSNFNRILDFGCGSGRVLSGWYVDNPKRQLYGVDPNMELINWAKSNFPNSVTFHKNNLFPPLDFEDNFFDCIYLLSVFTHLSLRNQFLWLEEFRRILKKNYLLIVTLHGPFYLSDYWAGRPEVYKEIINKRYWQNNYEYEGKNQFVTFHMPDFAINTLFKDWKVLAYFPGGRVRKQKMEPSIGVKQDIYVLTY